MASKPIKKPQERAFETDVQKTKVFDKILGWFFFDFSSIFKTFFGVLDNRFWWFLAKGRKPIRSRKHNVLRLKSLLGKTTIDTQKNKKSLPKETVSTSKK
jgi:hypothetical protein